MVRCTCLVAFLCSVTLRSVAVQLRQNGSMNAGSDMANPIMMFAHGCSMTTAGFALAQKILEAHSLKTLRVHDEMMKALDRYSSRQELVGWMGEVAHEDGIIDGIMSHDSNHLKEKFEVLYNRAKDHGKILFWKQEVHTADAHPDLMDFLTTVNTKAFLFLRMNVIDVMICRATDFCDAEENLDLGTLVDENGQEVACGFRDRGASQKQVTNKVRLNTTSILGKLKGAVRGDKLHIQYLKTHGFNYEINTAEDLLAFEYGSDTDSVEFQTSLNSWIQLVSSLGIIPNSDVIKQVLLDYGKFSAPKKHTETLYNFNDIKNVISDTKYLSMLRE